ncbi:MAG: hydrogenase formation protein [Burkholderiales bacterium]|nr:hydrogenase formation protein [Burkholderiales bacterium]
MTGPSPLAGRVVLMPGRPLPTVRNTRPDLAARLAPGRQADELPGLLAAVFTLCAHAHRLTAQRAVAAALGRPGLDDATAAQAAQALRLGTARDQLLRITHDWARLLPHASGADEGLLVLRACPLWRHDWPAADRLAALPAWLEHKWLGMHPQQWLRRFEADPLAWPQQWCETSASPVARLLRPQRAAALALATAHRPLDVLRAPHTHLPRLARAMAQVPGFCAQPRWQGEVPDTGPWTRVHDSLALPSHNAWMRCLSRVVDLLRLAAPGGDAWLAHGAMPLGPNEGLAWTEMARGLLLHRVQLEPGADGPRVAACQVLAPTEWNFHPAGVLAQALSGLQGPTMHDDALRLALAFDPCVEIDILLPEARTAEASHA